MRASCAVVLAFWGLFSTLGGDLGGYVCTSTSIARASEAAFAHSRSVLRSGAATRMDLQRFALRLLLCAVSAAIRVFLRPPAFCIASEG